MKKGFTLIEMIISIAIFTIIVVAFIGMLVAITGVGVQSSSSSVVSQESNALLSKIQYYVETASVVNIPTSTPTSTLQLFMASSSLDPTYITLASGTVYLQQTATGTPTALTSNRVTVTGLTFTRQSNPPAHDAVSVAFTMQNNTLSVAQRVSQLFQSTVIHAAAATFDTGVYASGVNEPLGTLSTPWTPINGIMYFTTTGNIGIGGQTSPVEPLDVNGGVRLDPLTSLPSCSSATRGTLALQSGNTGKDLLFVCAQNASGTPGWQQIN